MNFYQQRLAHLRDIGFSPKVIYDIGACRGGWTEEVEIVFPHSRFYLFEASPENIPELQKQKHPFFIEFLGDEDGITPFYAAKSGCITGNSVFRENTKHYSDENCQKRTLRKSALSSIVKKYQLPRPDFLKLDVQGAEKMVIQGGSEIISAAEVVTLEVQVIQYNHGAPLFLEVANFMDDLGFQMVDILDGTYVPRKYLINLDIVFIKKDSELIKVNN